MIESSVRWTSCKSFWFVFSFVLLMLLSLVIAPASVALADEHEQADEKPELTRYDSRYYIIYTDMVREDAAEYARHMDNVFGEYRKRFAALRPRNREKMNLFLYKDQKSYQLTLASGGVDGTNSGGMFVGGGKVEGLHVWVANRSRKSVIETLQHEGFHQFAANFIGYELPTWANEGLAQYFEDAYISKGKIETGVINAFRLKRVQKALKEGKSIDFDKLITVSGKEWSEILRSNPNEAGLYYAQAWSVAYFLIHADNGKYRGAFGNYLDLLSKGRSNEQAFEKAFGTNDYAAFEARWREFIEKAQPDPVSTAMNKLEFIGSAIQRTHKKHDLPEDVEGLAKYLAKVKYKGWQSMEGIRVEWDATEEDSFTYMLADKKTEKQFETREATPKPGNNAGTRSTNANAEEAKEENPRPYADIIAKGLKPMPVLTWKQDKQGQWYYEVVLE